MFGPDVRNSSKLCEEYHLVDHLVDHHTADGNPPLRALFRNSLASETMEKSQIDLIILSPSPEVNKLTFPAISTATTVGELREKISSAAVTHPAPARQRLIYRGHALIDAKKTLKEIFTQDIVCFQDV